MAVSLVSGSAYEIMGRWERSERFGQRFRILAMDYAAPLSLSAVRAFLASGVIGGLGPALSLRIVDRFGEGTLRVLRQSPERLLEIEGISEAVVANVTTHFGSRDERFRAQAELVARGMSTDRACRVLGVYGQEAIPILNAVPSRCAELVGVGGRHVHYAAVVAGISRTSETRARAALLTAMEGLVAQGDVCCPKEQVVRCATSLADMDRETLTEVAEQMVVEEVLHEEEGQWYVQRLWEAESFIRQAVSRLVRMPLVESFLFSSTVGSVTLMPGQELAVKRGLSYPLSIVTGEQGTGKSLVIGAVVRQARRLGLQVLVCTPSAQAAKRESEKMGVPVQTIQRALEYAPGYGCRRHAGRPFEADVVVVDDMTQVDVELARDVLAAIDPDRTGLMLVGDDGLVPSWGPGQVFQDLILSGLCPISRLSETHRLAAYSSIVRLAHQIRNGRLPAMSQDWGENHAWQLIEDPLEIQQRVVEAVLGLRKSEEPECQVLVPSRRGPLGSDQLNRMLQAALSPSPRSMMGRFRVGDRVRHCGVDPYRELYEGEIGDITEVHESEGYLVVRFGAREFPFLPSQLYQLDLAYCLPIAKAQSMTFRNVVMVMHPSHGSGLRADILYTGVTRAVERLLLVGPSHAYHTAVKRRNKERCSGLFRRPPAHLGV